MMRIAALNDASAGTNTKESPGEVYSTREAQEDAALTLYNQALQLQNDGDVEGAEVTFKDLLDVEILRQVSSDDIGEDDAEDSPRIKPASQQSRLLKYSAYKNLANIATKKGNHKDAMEFYLEATALDASDVTVWYRAGMTALEINNYPLAKLAFLEGIGCNPKHWPCLDNLITVFYALSNYYACLHYIAKSLEKNSHYVKGLAIRDQIYREEPGLRRDTEDLFVNCDAEIHSATYEEEESQKYIDEAIEMRRIKQELSRPRPRPILKFTRPLTTKTWKSIGECLVGLYDFVKKSEMPIVTDDIASSKCDNKECEVVADGTKSGTSAVNTSGSNSISNEQGVSSPLLIPIADDAKEQPIVVSDEIDCHMDVDDGHSLSQGENVVICETISVGSRKSRKRRSFYFECMDAASKRRSPRVRNTGTKKQPEYVNYYKLLQTFLPSSLKAKGDDAIVANCDGQTEHVEQIDGGPEVSSMKVAKDVGLTSVVGKLEDCESADIQLFLESVYKNAGILDIMYKYVIFLAGKQSVIWPSGLSELFVDVYGRLRNHITHPSIFSVDVDEEDIREEGMATLVTCEFKVDKLLALSARNPGTRSPSLSSRISTPTQVVVDLTAPRFVEDVDFLMQLTSDCRSDEKNVELNSRVLLLRAKIMMLRNEMDFAVSCLEEIVVLLQDESVVSEASPSMVIVNCKVDNVISLEQMQKQLESLQQCQSLEELHRSYHSGDYRKVVDLLVPTFTKPRTVNKVTNQGNIPERHLQLLLLQDALFNLGDQKKCFYWGEASFHEALLQYDLSYSSTTDSRLDWATTLTQLLSKLELCLTMEPSVVLTLPPTRLRRFIKNLIHLIHMQMQMDNSSESATVDGVLIKTVVPWILLYETIRQEELKIHSLIAKSNDADAKVTEKDAVSSFGDFCSAMPSSLMLLFNAHEHLGRRGWCCQSDGALLLLCAELFVDELRKSSVNTPHPFKEDLEVNAEQCFFCLYGHPNRKAKAKHLQEHGATSQVSLSWQRARPLFDYFKPQQLPEFDSYKVSTISTEVEYLLKRILTLVPADEDPASRVDFMCAYIEGSVADIPTFDLDLSTKPITSEMYYLLADYYFKNKEQGKAIKFYLLDVCVKPNRFDSWAGMALARSSQLEQKLNSCDLRSEGPIYRRAKAAFRCFKRALELNPSAASLWVENGSLAYMLHSYTCRQLKQRVQFDLSAEMAQMLKVKRVELLETAQQCFKSANRCEEGAEEEWLHHYMLGKIAEKMDSPPHEYLAHYKAAAHHLHIEGASYPNRIQYHSPPNLAMEALEVYYRTHASVLKYLLRHEGRSLGGDDLVEQVDGRLKEVTEEPFAKFLEKRHSEHCLSDTEVVSSPSVEHCKKPRKISPLSNDHDYFKRKRKSSSSEDLTAEPRQDSSSESQDSAAVKDLLNSIVSVVSERHADKLASGRKMAAIVVGDTKIYRPPSKSDRKRGSVIHGSGRSVVTVSEATGSDSRVGPKERSTSNDDIAEIDRSPDVEIIKVTGVQDHRDLARRCIDALKQCLQRFPQHYKSLYRLSHYYATSKYHKNIQWSCDYLVGPKVSWHQCQYMPTGALFAERKNSNFFNGIWRIPIDEIDRPGSFASHMFRSISLLVRILEDLRGHSLLVQITAQLHRDPDAGKKYLRDVDRLYLARLAYDRTVKTLLRRMRALCRVDTDSDPLAQPSAVRHMLDTYRAWQNLQKVVSNPQAINALLEKAYLIFRKGRVDGRLSCFDQAVRFCQQQMLIAKIARMPSSALISTGSIGTKTTAVSILTDKYARSIDTSSKGRSQLGLQHHSGTFRDREELNRPYRSPTTTSSTISSGASTSKSGGVIAVSATGHVLSSPNLLTADVQSKIKSLDPIVEPFRIMHQVASQQMSGFQLEFLRQITANLLPPPPPPPPPPSSSVPSVSSLSSPSNGQSRK